MKIKHLFYLIILVVVIVVYKNAYADNGIVVSDAWVQALPASATASAAYMTITNNSAQEMVLTSVSSDFAGAVEIHHMNDTNGMMRMAMVSAIHISPQDKVVLAPGGFHIMLINLKKPLKLGDMVSITLHFKDGSSVVVDAPIRGQDQSSGMQNMDMQGMKM